MHASLMHVGIVHAEGWLSTFFFVEERLMRACMAQLLERSVFELSLKCDETVQKHFAYLKFVAQRVVFCKVGQRYPKYLEKWKTTSNSCRQARAQVHRFLSFSDNIIAVSNPE